MSTPFAELCRLTRESALLESVESLLGWDERALMPPAAGPYRAEQMTFLSGLVHQRRTDPRIGELLAQATAAAPSADPHGDAGATLRQLRREYDKRIKLPQRLVEELTRASVLGQQAWVEARRKNDFPAFAPHLENIVRLKREQAAAMGWQDHPYDALLDDFEPGAKTAELTNILAALRVELVPLVQTIQESSRRPDQTVLRHQFPTAGQRAFGEAAAAAIGFDFSRGRLDVTHHPFCSGMGPNDCRITTRYDEHYFPTSFFGILHESGHGIYDQGLRTDQFGLPPGSAVSLGIHESQSRMWENQVGRSRPFWRCFLPKLQAVLAALKDVTGDAFFFAINDVRPSLIRVEADEATYNLHIIVRFELEQALLTGDLPIRDLPAAWSDKYQQYLGIRPPSDADGCLQDIHWSAGLFGYFPTYSLGNLYAAQFYEQADQDLGGLAEQFARGEFDALKQWLRKNIHTHGQCYTPAELVQRATGQPLTHAPLIRHLRGKLEPLYL